MATEELQRRTVRKVFWRIVPLLMFLYVIAYLDRINVSFAALTMNRDLGLSATAYGWGAGIFFLGYFLFEVPSNLIMLRVGARRWIARILFTWGAISTATMFVQGATSFLLMRFLLGLAEAGFFPGVILYLTVWFPGRYRARIVASFMISIPVSLAVGAPVSTAIMQLHGLFGLKGWQVLFLLEGLPAVLATIPTLLLMTDRPGEASWLTSEEKAWLAEQLALEKASLPTARNSFLREMITHPVILALSLVYFVATGANLGLSMFMPQMIGQLGYSTVTVGFLTSIPYLCGCVGMLVVGHLSDRLDERRYFLILTLTLAAAGLAGAGLLGKSPWAIACYCVAAVGILGCKGPFWPLPPMFLSGPAVAGGIALINAIGNLGGFAGPYLMGWLKDATHGFSSGLYGLSALLVLGAVVVLVRVRVPRGEPGPVAAPGPA
jgi:ACS family tartrate transporter-like MFS transporter